MLSDMARYAVLHRFGGVYLDLDFEALASIESVLRGHDLLFTRQRDGPISNAFIAAAPGSAILKYLLDACTYHEQRPDTTHLRFRAKSSTKLVTELEQPKFD